MASANIVLLLLLIVVTPGRFHMMAALSMDPWSFLEESACHLQGIDTYASLNFARNCYEHLADDGPMELCSKLEEKDRCVRPYYDELKKCFTTDEGKRQVEQAFNAQKESYYFFCKDNAKQYLELTSEDMSCSGQPSQFCYMDVMNSWEPDPTQLFAENNCKIMEGFLGCMVEGFDSCPSKKFGDFVIGQQRAILDATPCGHSEYTSSFHYYLGPIIGFFHNCYSILRYFV